MSTTYSLTAGQLITQSYRRIGGLVPPWTPSLDQLNQGMITLNILLKGLQADGTNLYRQTQLSLSVPTGVGYAGSPFSVTPLFLGLENARWVIQPAPNLYERPLGIYSYNDYMNLPNKLSMSSSGPSIICFDRQTDASWLYLWPLPTNGGTLNLSVARTVNDVNEPTDIPDYPIEWTEDMVYMLADRLMDDYGIAAADPETAQRITQRAVAFYAKLLNFDRPDSVTIRPWGRKGSGRFWR